MDLLTTDPSSTSLSSSKHRSKATRHHRLSPLPYPHMAFVAPLLTRVKGTPHAFDLTNASRSHARNLCPKANGHRPTSNAITNLLIPLTHLHDLGPRTPKCAATSTSTTQCVIMSSRKWCRALRRPSKDSLRLGTAKQSQRPRRPLAGITRARSV
jgi:hypothetical protein